MFHPLDKSPRAMFYRAHDHMMGQLHAYNEIMTGDNPLTKEERRRMATRWPDRYGFMMPKD